MNLLEYHHFTQEGVLPEHVTMTLEEFLENGLEGYEYVQGELIQMPATSVEHGLIGANIFLRLGPYVHEHQLGAVFFAETGFRVGDRVLKPDIAFLSTERIPTERRKASPVPPDLAVEVVSPTDMFDRVEEKAFAYLEAGTQMVWVIAPRSKMVMVYRSETDIKLLTCNDLLSGEDVVEGFSCEVARLFESPA